MNANAGFEIVKQRPEMVLGELGGNLTRRDGSALEQFRNAHLSDDFCATCQTLFMPDMAVEDNPQAGDMLRNKASGNAGEKDGGFVHLLLLDFPQNDVDAEPQTMVRQADLPTRVLHRSGAPIRRSLSVPGDRAGKESRAAEQTRQDFKSPPAQTQSTGEQVPAAEGIVLANAIALPQTAGRRPTASLSVACPHQENLDTTGLTRGARKFPHSDHMAIPPIRQTQESRPNGNASGTQGPTDSGSSTPDGEIESGTSSVRAIPRFPTHKDALATTDAGSNEGKEMIPAEELHLGGPREPAPASSFKKDVPDSISTQSRTPKGSSAVSTEKPQVRNEAAGPPLAGHGAQSRQPAEFCPIRVKHTDTQHFGAEIVRDSPATLIGSQHDTPEVARASRSSGADLSGREVLAALDAEKADSAPVWVRAGKQEVEAGYRDPELGWVTVRAHAVTTGIHAALVPGSMEASQPLSEHLAGLNAYLADHHSSVHPVSISSPEAAREELSTGQGMDHGAAQGDRGEQHARADTETWTELVRGSRQGPNLNTQPGDAIEPLADFTRQRRTISLVV